MLLALLACAGPPPSPTPAARPASPAAPPASAVPVGTDAVSVVVGDVRPDRVTVHVAGPAGRLVAVQLRALGSDQPRVERLTLDARSGTAVHTFSLPPQGAVGLTASLMGAPGLPNGASTVVSWTPAPTQDEAAPLSLALVGDLGGQGWCRRRDGGYAILGAVRDARPDVVLFNGDQIYADNTCGQADPSGAPTLPGTYASVTDVDWRDATALRSAFDGHWQYQRADPTFQALAGVTSFLVQWDDHEVVNDFGAAWDRWWTGDPARPGFPTLVAEGRAAFRRFNPIETDAQDPDRIYRSVRWGRNVEVFLADARSYRSPNPDPDGPDKQLLGADQLRWLVDGLTQSDATWKLVSVDVPLAQPTGSSPERNGRDGWASGATKGATGRAAASGYERELGGLLSALDAAHVKNVVFLATDVHYARTARYRVDADGDGTPWETVEVISGPLSAWMGKPDPSDPDLPAEVLYAEGDLPNFATLTVAPDGKTLTVRTVGGDGKVRPGSEIVLTATP